MAWTTERIKESNEYDLFLNNDYVGKVIFSTKDYDLTKIKDEIIEDFDTDIYKLVKHSVENLGFYEIEVPLIRVITYNGLMNYSEKYNTLNVSHNDYLDLLSHLDIELDFLDFEEYERVCNNFIKARDNAIIRAKL